MSIVFEGSPDILGLNVVQKEGKKAKFLDERKIDGVETKCLGQIHDS